MWRIRAGAALALRAAAVWSMTDASSPRLAKTILSYYVKHPMAADTTEGLARWRLLEEYVEKTTRETEQALEWLVREGYLSARTGPGNRRVFTLNADRRQEAETFIADPEDETRGDR
jgi:hypothetical protein